MITDQFLRVEMPNGTVFVVPIKPIALSRAEYYASEFNDNVELSLQEDTIPLFEYSHYEIEDWFVNNMNWSDIAGEAKLVRDPDPIDFGDLLGEAEIGVIINGI